MLVFPHKHNGIFEADDSQIPVDAGVEAGFKMSGDIAAAISEGRRQRGECDLVPKVLMKV